jgi:GMP synthase-like glutamine amidotransferase
MKPVAIFRHNPTEGPGYFATFLEAHSIPFTLIAIDCGDPVPARADAFSGLCFMGGPMSVNDPLDWITEECALIRLATEQDIPVIGHCLGGQLMSQALGGTITRNPVKEIGWGSAVAENNELAHLWLGNALDGSSGAASVFQWHGETFSLPPGATRILTNDFCANQAFVLGPHLGMQCHVEMTPEMIEAWCKSWASEVAGLSTGFSPLPNSVQTPEQMQAATSAHLDAMRQLAEQLYRVWISGLVR